MHWKRFSRNINQPHVMVLGLINIQPDQYTSKLVGLDDERNNTYSG